MYETQTAKDVVEAFWRNAHDSLVAYPVDSGTPRYSMSSDLTGHARLAGWTPDGQCALTFRVSEGVS
jgi:hypothetical protein